MKTSFANLALFVMTLLVTLTVISHAQNETFQRQDELLLFRSEVLPYMKSPALADYKPQFAHFSPDDKEDPSLYLEDEDCLHPEGIYSQAKNQVSVFKNGKLYVGLYGEPSIRILNENLAMHSQEECLETGTDFLKNTFPWFFQEALPPVKTSGPDSTGLWTFSWQRYRVDELPASNARVRVRAIDGKIVDFGVSEFLGDWQHKLTPTQAKQIAIKTMTSAEVKDVKVINWNLTGGGGHRFYSVALEGTAVKTDQRLETGIEVEANTGEVNESIEGWQPLTLKDGPQISDTLPVWTKSGLLFSSTRPLAEMPSWAHLPAQGLLRDATGRMYHLSQDFQKSPRLLTGLSNSNWIGFDRGAWDYVLNLDTGAYKLLSNGNCAALTADGTRAVTVARLHPYADKLSSRDLWPKAVSKITTSGIQSGVVFSPDGQWLYLVASKYDQKTMRLVHSLERLPRDAVEHPENSKTTAAIKLVTLPGWPQAEQPVQRLSFFPSGERLLAQTPDGLLRIDINGKRGKVSSISLAKLIDKEIGANLTEIRDGWAGPSENEVTFSAQTQDATRIVRRRIYSCRFDGSALRAWTPKDLEPVTHYKFPNGLSDSAGLAREWALMEVEYEKKHK